MQEEASSVKLSMPEEIISVEPMSVIPNLLEVGTPKVCPRCEDKVLESGREFCYECEFTPSVEPIQTTEPTLIDLVEEIESNRSQEPVSVILEQKFIDIDTGEDCTDSVNALMVHQTEDKEYNPAEHGLNPDMSFIEEPEPPTLEAEIERLRAKHDATSEDALTAGISPEWKKKE